MYKNCLTDGKKCTVCNKTIESQKTIQKTAHTEKVIEAGLSPTCFNSGYTATIVCANCNYSISTKRTLSALTHTFDSNNYCNLCGLKVYKSVAEFKNDCQVGSNSFTYNKSYYYVQITLDSAINGYGVILSGSVGYLKIIGDSNKTFTNVYFEFTGTDKKYLVTQDLNIETKRSIFVAKGTLYFYATGGKNSFVVTGSAAKGADGKTAAWKNGTNGENGATGYSCIEAPNCYLYTKCTSLYMKAGKGGTGGAGGGGSGLGFKNGNGGNGGQGGNVVTGNLYVNKSNSNDIYSSSFSGSGSYTLLAGDGGNAGSAGNGLLCSGGSNGSKGSSGYVASNVTQSGLQG